MRDDVTVIVTTIDARRELAERAIASATGQARVIVSNDGDRPRWHGYVSWWEGLWQAQTPYVAILHDDDWYEPTFIERCASLFDKAPDVGFVFSEALVHFPDGTTRTNLDLAGAGVAEDGWMDQAETERIFLSLPCTISPSCVVMRRDDALNSLPVGGVPGAPRRSVVCGPDLLMVMLPILKHRFFGIVADPLAHFDGGMQSTTIEALSEEQKHRDLLATYADARRYYLAVKQCWSS